MKELFHTLPLILFLLASAIAEAGPESITPGLSYYAEDYVTQGEVSEVGVEKDYEYFESIYDDTY